MNIVNHSCFWNCVIYYAGTGIASFVLGRLLPKHWFHPQSFWFRCHSFEENGRLYEKLRIRHWQKRVPDMSKILPWIMPAKKLAAGFQTQLPRMLEETCVAEFTHVLLCVTGLYGLKLWPGPGGLILYILYVTVFNLPFILIQRYNRPRLLRLLHKLQPERSTKTYAYADFDLQYR